MPLDTSTYHLSLLRLDGRRWNELRRLSAQISTQASADGSSYLELGNTKVICTVAGPAEIRGGGGGGGGGGDHNAVVNVEVGVAGFAGVDRKRRRGDRQTTSLASTIASAFSSTLFTHLYLRSTILIHLHVLSSDGSLLAACLNATTLACIDAGIPMSDYIVACTAGMTPPKHLNHNNNSGGSNSSSDDGADPLLDLNSTEEQELPWLTVGTVGAGEKVAVLVMERRVMARKVEGMLAAGVDGCRQVREILDGVVRTQGKRILGSGVG